MGDTMKDSNLVTAGILYLLTGLAGGLASGPVWSADDWYWTGSGQVLLRNYSDSLVLDNLTGFGLRLDSDHLKRGGFVLGYNFNQRNYKPAPTDAVDRVDENIVYAGGHISFFPDTLPGSLTLWLDGFAGRDEIHIKTVATGGGMGGGSSGSYSVNDDITVVNPRVSFINYDKTLYTDLGYAFSAYRSDDGITQDIDIQQWTPTLGLGFNQAYDWLQLRGYLIGLSDSNRVPDTDSTSAIEAKWMHWFERGALLGLHRMQLTVLAGERLYAVDSDAHALYSLADLQTGSLAVGAEWKLSERSNLFLQGAYERFKNLTLDDEYASPYLYLYLSQSW